MSSMDSNVKAVTVSGTGVAYANRAHLRGISYVASGAARVVLKDGSGSATQLDLSGVTTTAPYLLLPGRGILFETSINVTTLTNISSLTLFYEG